MHRCHNAWQKWKAQPRWWTPGSTLSTDSKSRHDRLHGWSLQHDIHQSANPVQRDILSHRHSQLSDLTIRLYTTSLKSISQKRWLHHLIFKWSFWPVQFSGYKSRDQSFFVLIDQSPSADMYRYGDHKYVNIHRHQLFIFSEINNGWWMTATVL